MKDIPKDKQKLYIGVVLAAGIVLAALILLTQGGQKHPQEPDATGNGTEISGSTHQKGPHGGKLFTRNGYELEISIFEEGSEPRFRIHTYLKDKPLSPSASRVVLTLERLGRPPQRIRFMAKDDYLLSDAVIGEPHSFKVAIEAEYGGQSYRFNYEQIEARVHMSDQQVKQEGIEILTAGPARIQDTLSLIGHIGFNENNVVYIVPRLAGVVESVGANAGDRVRKGQVLAVLSSPVLADLRSELLAAQKRLGLARVTYEREKKLWEEKISAEQDYLQARSVMQEAEIVTQQLKQKLASLGGSMTNGSDLARYEIRAPIDGTVMLKKISVGQVLKEDADIFVVADLSTVWAVLTIYPKDLNAVKIGQQATIRATSFEYQGSGSVDHIGALLGEQTRTAEAHIILPNPGGIWRPGLPVNIELVLGETTVPVAVSAEAIHTMNNWTAVFFRHDSVFEARQLKPGRRDGSFVEVLDGLDAGERYAAKNSFLIKADLGKSGAAHDH